MGLDKEIRQMRKRLNKLVPQIQPPELKMFIIGANDPVPTTTAWELTLRVEDKDPAFNA